MKTNPMIYENELKNLQTRGFTTIRNARLTWLSTNHVDYDVPWLAYANERGHGNPQDSSSLGTRYPCLHLVKACNKIWQMISDSYAYSYMCHICWNNSRAHEAILNAHVVSNPHASGTCGKNATV